MTLLQPNQKQSNSNGAGGLSSDQGKPAIRTIHAINANLTVPQSKVLSYISELYRHSKNTYKGQKFVVTSRKLIAEKNNLSLEQLRRALERLTEWNLIEIQVHISYGERKSFIRPLVFDLSGWDKPKAAAYRAIKKQSFGKDEMGQMAVSEMGQSDAFMKVSSSAISLKITDSNNKLEEQSCATASGSTLYFSSKNSVLEDFGEKINLTEISPGDLYEVWKNSQESYVRPMDGKFGGIFKFLITSWPQGESKNILSVIMKSWDGFVSYLEETHGAFKLPKVPSLETISKYPDQAVVFYRRRAAEEVVWAEWTAQKDAKLAPLEPANDIQAVIPPQELPKSLSELYPGAEIPEGGSVTIQDDELMIRDKHGAYVSPVAQKFGGDVFVYGVEHAVEVWQEKYPGKPLPNPSPYFMGAVLEKIENALQQVSTQCLST